MSLSVYALMVAGQDTNGGKRDVLEPCRGRELWSNNMQSKYALETGNKRISIFYSQMGYSSTQQKIVQMHATFYATQHLLDYTARFMKCRMP